MTATSHQPSPLPIPPGYHACRACHNPYIQEAEGQDSCRLCAGGGRKQATFPLRATAKEAAQDAPGQEQSDLTTAYLLGESRGRDATVAQATTQKGASDA